MEYILDVLKLFCVIMIPIIVFILVAIGITYGMIIWGPWTAVAIIPAIVLAICALVLRFPMM